MGCQRWVLAPPVPTRQGIQLCLCPSPRQRLTNPAGHSYLQMGWIESPAYFCLVTETGRNVTADYCATPIGSLLPHKFIKKISDKEAILETISNGNDDKEDEDDNSTHNAKLGSNPPCDWEGVKCYSLGIRPSMCCRSGCKKIAHQYCQDQQGRKHSIKPYNVLYALCRDHHLQYCRYIEELNIDNDEKFYDNGCKELFATANNAESNIQQSYNEKQDDDDEDVKSEQIFYDIAQEEEEKEEAEEAEEAAEEEDDADDDVADLTYKLRLDMLDFDFNNIDVTLDSDDESVILHGKKKKSNRSPKKNGKRKSASHDDGDPERPDVSQILTEEANARLAQYCKE